jgi:predicted RNA-binding Zn-ribbon protein involved in translation (DUF1610 family)
MSVMFTVCPDTGEEISTGIELDADDFKRLPHVVVYSRCPRCGMQHLWRTHEAMLVEVSRERLEKEAADPTDS